MCSLCATVRTQIRLRQYLRIRRVNSGSVIWSDMWETWIYRKAWTFSSKSLSGSRPVDDPMFISHVLGAVRVWRSFVSLTSEKNLDDMITFTGRISDAELLEILSTADVCVNPDKPCSMNSMSTMIKIMEYMALGKPIVQFEGIEGRFSAQEASLYSDSSDHVGDFAAKIAWLLDHPEERMRMGDFGRRRIEKELAWEFSVETFSRRMRKRLARFQASTGCRPIAPEAIRGHAKAQWHKRGIA